MRCILKLKTKTKVNIFAYCMIIWPLIHWLIFTLYMNLQTVNYSFQRWNQYLGITQFVGFDNYKDFFVKIFNNYEEYALAFRNTLLFIPFNVLVILPISLFIAYCLSKKIPFSSLYETVFFLPSIISIVILTMTWQFMFDPMLGVVNGLLDMVGLSGLKQTWLGDDKTALPVIFAFCLWAGIGWNTLVLSGAVRNIPKELFESAEIDGITPGKEFTKIVIPTIWPTINTLIIMGIASAFVVYLQPQLLTNGQYGTMTVALKTVKTVLSGDYGLASATGIAIGVCGFTVTYIIKFFTDKIDKRWS